MHTLFKIIRWPWNWLFKRNGTILTEDSKHNNKNHKKAVLQTVTFHNWSSIYYFTNNREIERWWAISKLMYLPPVQINVCLCIYVIWFQCLPFIKKFVKSCCECYVTSVDHNQTARMRKLIWVYIDHKYRKLGFLAAAPEQSEYSLPVHFPSLDYRCWGLGSMKKQ